MTHFMLRADPRSTKKRGFVLLVVALCAVGLLGVVGLAVDLGRLYVAKGEVQTFSDSAALAATMELDGTGDGLTRARAQVTANRNRWNFGASEILDWEIYFAQNEAGPWEANPTRANGYKFTRVVAQVSVPLLFYPASLQARGDSTGSPAAFLLLAGATASVRADSHSGQVPQGAFREGLFPFSPFAHNSVGPHFGLAPGQKYTLRWASNPRLNQNVCPGDNRQEIIDLAQAGSASERGYIEENSSAVIREAIERDYQTTWRGIGDTVNMTGGAKQTQLASLRNRINQDTDPYSATYEQYAAGNRGNGRRLVGAPINTGAPDYRVVQIGAFFLLPVSEYDSGGNRPFCAEYVGAWVQGSSHKGVEESGAHVVRLIK